MRWLVSLRWGGDPELAWQAPAVVGGAEQVEPGPVGTAGSVGGLAVHGHRAQPSTGQHLCLLRGAPGAVAAHDSRGRPSAEVTWPGPGTATMPG